MINDDKQDDMMTMMGDGIRKKRKDGVSKIDCSEINI